MINILVGLIFEAYGRIRSAAGEPETLLEQVGEAVENLKDRDTPKPLIKMELPLIGMNY